jgi:hypothetical protein
MASLDISEYMDSNHGNPIEPPVAHQVVALGAEPAQSKPFHKNTKVVRLVADVNCRVSFGGDPTEARSFVPAGRELIRTVHADGTFRLAAVLASPADSADGAMSANGAAAFLTFVHVLADPAKSKALADKLARAKSDADAACIELSFLRGKESALIKERAAFDKFKGAEQAKLQEQRDQLAAQVEQLEADKREHAAKVAALAQDRAALQQSRAEHEQQLSELARLRKLLSVAA